MDAKRQCLYNKSCFTELSLSFRALRSFESDYILLYCNFSRLFYRFSSFYFTYTSINLRLQQKLLVHMRTAAQLGLVRIHDFNSTHRDYRLITKCDSKNKGTTDVTVCQFVQQLVLHSHIASSKNMTKIYKKNETKQDFKPLKNSPVLRICRQLFIY